MKKNVKKPLRKPEKTVVENEAAPEDAAPEEPETADAAPDPDGPTGSGEAAEPEPAEPDPPEPPELEPLEHQLLRLRADFDNYRKRTARERSEWTRQALENLVTDLLPVLDHFELGLDNARKQDAPDAVVKGFELVEEQLRGALRKFDLQAIDAGGAPFNPELHEALSFLPSAEAPADTVLEQVRRGYRLGDRLIRPAQVVVSSGAADAPDDPGGGAHAEDEHVDG